MHSGLKARETNARQSTRLAGAILMELKLIQHGYDEYVACYIKMDRCIRHGHRFHRGRGCNYLLNISHLLLQYML